MTFFFSVVHCRIRMAENKKAPQKPEHLILDMVLIVEIEEIQAGGKLYTIFIYIQELVNFCFYR